MSGSDLRHESSSAGLLAAGMKSLARGEWHDACALMSRTVEEMPPGSSGHARAATGLSDALWWSGLVEEALAAREKAYETWRRLGDDAEAARVALWLATEYRGALGNDAAAQGWLARAETLSGSTADGSVLAWITLTRSLLMTDRPAMMTAAAEALAQARADRDGELEALALSRMGRILVTEGDLEAGLLRFHEAMAIATGGETSLMTLGTLCCDLALATEVWGDMEPFAQWNEVIVRIAAQHGHPPLISFCATCCAEVFAASGDWSGAEEQLRVALDMLRQSGQHARCIAPSAKLADLLVMQGRLEEAEDILADDDGDSALLVRARLALERSDARSAVALLDRACRRLGGDSLLTVPALALLVDAHLACNEVPDAAGVVDRLAALAHRTANRRVAGRAALASARVQAAGGDAGAAIASLETALDHFAVAAPGGTERAEAHFELARLYTAIDPTMAATEARSALSGFEAAGAPHRADNAAALLRTLGVRSRTLPRSREVLTHREQEVLRLVALGLTNAEVADRLYISSKTAENHVSNILTKLNLRSRVEAAAYALAHADE